MAKHQSAQPKATQLIPATAQFAEINGQEFVRVREAAKLAGIHPVVLQMGQTLLNSVNLDRGATFVLGTPEMKARAADIQKVFTTGLRRVAKAFKPNVKYKVRSHRESGRLVFWYSA